MIHGVSMCHITQTESSMSKLSDILSSITEEISTRCHCPYTVGSIIAGQLFCDVDRNQLLYQAQLLKSLNTSSEDIRSFAQDWVLSQPSVVINGTSFKLDSTCPVEVKTFGVTSCTSLSSTTESATESSTSQRSRSPSVYELASIVGVGLILLLLTVVVIALITYCVTRKSRKYSVTKKINK